MGAFGCMYIDCPLCGRDNMLENNEFNIILSKNNIEFPTHFFEHSTENGAVDTCKNEYITKEINRAINYFRTNKEEFAWTTGTGNTEIHVYRFSDDEEYNVVVSENYYDAHIPFEAEDY